MKVTYKQVLEASKPLLELTKIGMPIKTSLEVARLSSRVDSEIEIYKRTMQGLLAKHELNPRQAQKEGWLNFSMQDEGENEEESEKLKRQKLETFLGELNELLNTIIPDFDIDRITVPESALLALAKSENDEAQPHSLKSISAFIEVV